jgi:hypothetical protein
MTMLPYAFWILLSERAAMRVAIRLAMGGVVRLASMWRSGVRLQPVTQRYATLAATLGSCRSVIAAALRRQTQHAAAIVAENVEILDDRRYIPQGSPLAGREFAPRRR